MEKTIEIPEGYQARIEGNKVILEPKESEDERIRKAILELVKQSSHILNPTNQKSMIAWLEKQGEQKPSTSVTEFDTEVERFCKECFITDINEKGRVFCIARHFADWQKNRES